MITMIRAVARVCIAAVAVTAFLPTAPSHAENVAYVSAAGNDGASCTATQPCANLSAALFGGPALRVICLNGSGLSSIGFGFGVPNLSLDIDCPQGYLANLGVGEGPVTVRIRHLSFWDSQAGGSLFKLTASGTVILDDCVFTDAAVDALDIEPSGPLNLVIRNSRISNGGAAGIILKPAAGGSINATFDHVTVTGNSGGGIRADSTNGLINLDVTDSEISNNTANGIIAIAGASQNMVSVKNSVIARNGLAGIAANGANTGVIAQTTLLDQNVAGATSLSGGHIITYQNNSIIGSAGSGFTATASPQ